ncbi:MAG TPA: hypothetical protein PLY87_16505, partial [Planctomycetaceae bacterium]|nr:hypothetical protein [Planctomycetaceae bacterium]
HAGWCGRGLGVIRVPIPIQPLTYRRSKVGYLLYSVGVNLQDDDGVTRSDAIEINGREADDIAVRTPDEELRIKAMIKEQRSK